MLRTETCVLYIVAEFHQKNGNYRKLQVAEAVLATQSRAQIAVRSTDGNFAIIPDSSGVIFLGIFAAAVSTDSETLRVHSSVYVNILYS